MSYTTRREGCPLGAVETWIFDLDNTLYPASCLLFEQIQRRMNEYISRLLSVSPEAAAELRRTFFLAHGTTMHGLMALHHVDPHEFMAFVQDRKSTRRNSSHSQISYAVFCLKQQ